MESSAMFSFVGEMPRIYLLSNDQELSNKVVNLWDKKRINWEIFTSGKALLERFFNDPPHMIICGEYSEDLSGSEIINLIKSENVYKQICTVLLMSLSSLQDVFKGKIAEVDDFIILPCGDIEMRARLELALQRSTCTLDANPLTRLPGNASIMQVVEKHINEKTDFAAAYLDIDNFKAFNDKYGFSRGDEALLVTARLLVASIMDYDAPYKFLGHIGGDDFFFLVPEDCMESICQRIIASYDEIIPHFYDDEDKANKGIISHDRQGNIHRFPFMSVSIGITCNTDARFTRYAEVSQALGQLKKVCKEYEGSVYKFDQRKD